MSEENQQPETQEVAEEVTQEPQAPAERTFTQAELNSVVAREVAKAKRKAKRELESQTAETTTKQEPAASTGQDQQILAMLQSQTERIQQMEADLAAEKSEGAFKAAVAGMSLSDHDLAMLRALHGSNPEVFAAEIDRRRAADRPPEKKGPGFQGIQGAPNPHLDPAKKPPSEWTGDDIAAMQKDGTLLKRAKEYRNSLPGGSGGLFPAKNVGKG